MQILAGSLNVEVGQFLHAGYLSAYPRTFQDKQGGYLLATKTAKLIDVKKAVELKDSKDQAASTTTAEVASPALPSAMMASEIFTLAVVFFFFAYLIGLYYRRARKITEAQWKPWLFAAIPVLIFAVVRYWTWPAYEACVLDNLPKPWEGVPVKKYRDPQAATEAILHTLIANALLGVPVNVRGLAAIQNEVAFPIAAAEYTPGMKYSQKAYGRDGWGKEFSFEQLADDHNRIIRYRIISAGPDGKFGTKDDIAFVSPANGDTWESNIGGMFFRVAEGRKVFFIHRIASDLFLRANAEDARRLTGTDLFDAFGPGELRHGYRDPTKGDPPIVALLNDRLKSDAANEETDELLFVKFEGKRNE